MREPICLAMDYGLLAAAAATTGTTSSTTSGRLAGYAAKNFRVETKVHNETEDK